MSAATVRRIRPFFFFFLLQVASSVAHSYKDCKFKAIYNFGDSISDTGNLIREAQLGVFVPITSLPYGRTYFRRPTGRCSDGMLIVDFLAQSLGLPLLNPYLDRNASFVHGVNFAVAGATALKPSFFTDRGPVMPFTNSSLEVQIDWFHDHLSFQCSSQTGCAMKLEKALFLVGEIGGNDYNYALLQGKSIHEVKEYVPHVVQTIKDAARHLIQMGAVHLIIPGNFPIGCLPIYLTAFHTVDPTAYDEDMCLKSLNDFSMCHNDHLKRAINDLNEEFPNVSIAYADYYSALKGIIHLADENGFNKSSSLNACCGGGGPYNYNQDLLCGVPGSSVCSNPQSYISWDGIHQTQHAYQQMALRLFKPIFKEWGCRLWTVGGAKIVSNAI